MIVYLAGRITGDGGYREKFADAEMALRELGHVVLNPAMLPNGLEYEAYMAIGNQMLLAADAICLLPDWQSSAGAQRERTVAMKNHKSILHYDKINVRGSI